MLPVILTVCLGVAHSQSYDQKTALIIGNTNYEVGKLRNPVNDARTLGETLEQMGFDVLVKYDLDKEGLRAAVREFGNAIQARPGVAFFYYSGHGLQSDGVNYLVPVDADIQEEYEIADQCVSADQVLRMLTTYDNPFNIIILDACRNNPYESRYRSASRGLAQPEIVPTGSIMAYSTSPGRTASDGEGENGLYTQELVKAMNIPGLDIEDVFKQTRINVMAISDEQQIPWETSSLVGDFYFLHEGDAPVAVGTGAVGASVAKTPREVPDPTLSQFTDSRDGTVYPYVKIGDWYWMARNLEYETSSGSVVNDLGDRYYTWEVAKKACPEGWRLPDASQWGKMVKAAGGRKAAGVALKSTRGWKNDGNGTNSSGFNARPTGKRNVDGVFSEQGTRAYHWISAKAGEDLLQARVLFNNDDGSYINTTKPSLGRVYLSVRCMRKTLD